MPAEDLRQKNNCSQIPSLVSAFVDTFVDYAVGGQFLSPHSSESRGSLDESAIVSREGPNGLSDDEKGRGGANLPARIPATERLIAIGDIHGDLKKAKEALLIAGVMDVKEKWVGGETVVVQVGDLLDRGGDEIKVIYLLEKLKLEAQRQGGDVHIMNGNHEVMNVEGDFRYATPAGLDGFERWAEWYKMGNVLKERCKGLEKPYDFFKNIPKHFSDGCKARMAALRPGGPISSRFLASHPTILIVGGTVFVHGGLLSSHVEYGLEKINRETMEWLQGKNEWRGPNYLHGKKALVWMRKYSNEEENRCDCDELEKALSAVTGAKRMVMGHTIQNLKGINSVCSNKAVRVDVGMSQGCKNGAPEVLEIRNDKVMTVLSASSALRLMDMEDISSQLERQKEGTGLASLLSLKSETVKVHVNHKTTPNL